MRISSVLLTGDADGLDYLQKQVEKKKPNGSVFSCCCPNITSVESE